MRRKLFVIAVILLITVFLLSEAFPGLWVPGNAAEDETACIHTGCVYGIKEKNGRWIIDVKDDRGFRIRLNYYGELGAAWEELESTEEQEIPRENYYGKQGKGSSDDLSGISPQECQGPWELIGSRISYSAQLTVPDPARNPRCFDYAKYLKSEDIYLSGTVKSFLLTDTPEDPLDKYRRFLMKLKYGFRASLTEEDRGLIMGMIFGDTGDLEEDIYEDFRRNGTAHILAVSGLHIGILYSIYEKLTGGRTDHGRLILLMYLLVTYGILTGWRPSVVRAELMIAMKSLAKALGLRYDSLTAMSLAAILLILNNPYVIYGTGFQMSFLAIMAINIVMKAIPKKVPDTLAQTLAVNITLMLYQAYVFNYITPLAVLINIPILYLAGISIPLSCGTFLIYVSAGLINAAGLTADAVQGAGLINAAGLTADATSGAGLQGLQLLPEFIYVPAACMSRLLTYANGLLSLGGNVSLDVISPPTWIMIFVMTSLFFGCSELADLIRIRKDRKYFFKCMIVILIASVLLSFTATEPMSHDQIVFVDVGQGACTHIRSGALDVLVDGGGSHNRNVGEKTLKPYLLKNGSRDLDLALVTHEDTDHYQGLKELDECFKVKELKVWAIAGNQVKLDDDVYIETLWPLSAPAGAGASGKGSDTAGSAGAGSEGGSNSGETQSGAGSSAESGTSSNPTGDTKQGNDESSVFMVHYRGVRILITGDMGEEGEREMVTFYERQGKLNKLRADVLNVGHHGSKYSSCDEFLDAVRPKLAVIQVGRNNYGHPSPDTLERLAAHGARILRNDEAGAVGLRIGSDGIKAVHVMIGK